MEIGVGLAAAVALMTNLASLLKHRGCQHAQPVSINRPLASLRGLAASPWFAAGWGLASGIAVGEVCGRLEIGSKAASPTSS